MPVGELRGDQIGDVVECAGQHPSRAFDEPLGLPRVEGVKPVLEWSGRTGLYVELRVEELRRDEIGGTGLFLPFRDGVREGGRCGLRVRNPGRKGLHVGKGSVSENCSCTPREVDRRGVRHETGSDALSVP